MVQTLRRYLRLYRLFLSQYLKRLMEYRVDFFVGLSSFMLFQISGIVFLGLLFQRIPSLNGWSFDQILFIYGFAQIPRGLDHLLTDNLWMPSMRIIVKGEFDRYLVRPMNPLFHLIAEVFQPDALGELLVGVALTVTAAVRLGLRFGPWEILMFTAVILLAAVIYFSIKLFFASFAFWIKLSIALLWFNYSLSDFAKYPIGIYHPLIRIIISFVIPFAFTAFYPAGFFVGRVTLPWALGGTALGAVLSFTLAYGVWLAGIRRYESAGS